MKIFKPNYKLGSKVKLTAPYLEQDAEIIGIRFSQGSVKYECETKEYILENVSPYSIISESNEGEYEGFHTYSDDEFYLFFEDNKYIDNCKILGLYIYLDTNNVVNFRYKVGYKPKMTVFNDVNPSLIFTKDEALVKLRSLKLDKI
jgi:hypothetical protein